MKNILKTVVLLLCLLLTPKEMQGSAMFPTEEARVLAGLVCGECKGCSREERRAVIHVPLNRANSPGWWGRDLMEIMTKPKQFAHYDVPMCRWNLPRRSDGLEWSPGMVYLHNKILLEIREDVLKALEGRSKDLSGGSTYFHARRLGNIWNHLQEVSVPHHWHHRFFQGD